MLASAMGLNSFGLSREEGVSLISKAQEAAKPKQKKKKKK